MLAAVQARGEPPSFSFSSSERGDFGHRSPPPLAPEDENENEDEDDPRFPPIALYLAFLRYVLVGLRVSQKKPVSRLTLNAGRVTLAA